MVTYKLVDARMQALIGLSNPNNTLAALQLFHDLVEGHIRSLESLGTPQDKYGSMLVPIILKKLSPETRKNFARGQSITHWALTELQKAILLEVCILEMGTDYSNQQGSLPIASFLAGAVSGTDRHPHKRTKEHQTRPGCVYCKGPHTPSTCDSITDKKKHMEIIKRDMLCFNCLSHHKISQCKSKFCCRHCNKRHHTSICTNSSPPPATSETTTTITGATNNTTTNSTSDTTSLTILTSDSPPSSHQSYLLKTAVATVMSVDREAEANILFDEGSQCSFLTQDLADALSLTPHH